MSLINSELHWENILTSQQTSNALVVELLEHRIGLQISCLQLLV